MAAWGMQRALRSLVMVPAIFGCSFFGLGTQCANTGGWSVKLPELPVHKPSSSRVLRTFRVGARDYQIAEEWGLVSGGVRGTGARVWPASVHLAQFLADNENLVCGKCVVELGAGISGLPAIVAANAGARSVLVSDGERSAISLLRENMTRNCKPGTCEVRQVCWGKLEDEHALDCADIILGADVVWGGGGGSAESQRQLLACLTRAAAGNPRLVVLISFCPRYKSEARFWLRARAAFAISRWCLDEPAKASTANSSLAEPPRGAWADFAIQNRGPPACASGTDVDILICRLIPRGNCPFSAALAHDDCLQSQNFDTQELLSDDSLLEAGGAALNLDDLVNPLDVRR